MRYGATKFADHSMELSTRNVITTDWIDLRGRKAVLGLEEVDIDMERSGGCRVMTADSDE